MVMTRHSLKVNALDDRGHGYQPDTLADLSADPLQDIRPARIAPTTRLHLGRLRGSGHRIIACRPPGCDWTVYEPPHTRHLR
jgi:hypothetical protein